MHTFFGTPKRHAHQDLKAKGHSILLQDTEVNPSLVEELESQAAQQVDLSQKTRRQQEAAYLLERGHNVCVVGEGSKIQVLKEVAQEVSDALVVRVDGYDEEYRFKRLLKVLVDTLQGHSNQPPRHPLSQDALLATLDNLLSHKLPFAKVLLMVNNLDGKQLRSQEQQRLMASVVKMPRVQLLCSLDNVAIQYLLTPSLQEDYNLIFLEIHSAKAFQQELARLRTGPLARQQQQQSSVEHILQSLTGSQRQILRALAELALERDLEPVGEGELLEKCLDLMVSKSLQDITLNLREARDHSLLQLTDHAYRFLLDRESVQRQLLEGIEPE